jgi:hypothetical protein
MKAKPICEWNAGGVETQFLRTITAFDSLFDAAPPNHRSASHKQKVWVRRFGF